MVKCLKSFSTYLTLCQVEGHRNWFIRNGFVFLYFPLWWECWHQASGSCLFWTNFGRSALLKHRCSEASWDDWTTWRMVSGSSGRHSRQLTSHFQGIGMDTAGIVWKKHVTIWLFNSSRPPSAKGLYPWTWVHLALPHLSRWESPFLRGWRPRSLVPNRRWCRHPWNLHEQISLNSKSWS